MQITLSSLSVHDVAQQSTADRLTPPMALPTVSVIIPSRNRPAFLREAILSAINQTLPPLEILVIDNGSDPDAREAIVRLTTLHDCVRFIALDRNHGTGHARNVGLGVARGDWILFLDDDDILFVDFLERCFKALPAREDGAQVVLGRALRFQDGRSTSYPRDLITGFNLRAYRKDPVSALLTQGVAVGSCLVSREAIGPRRFSHASQVRRGHPLLAGVVPCDAPPGTRGARFRGGPRASGPDLRRPAQADSGRRADAFHYPPTFP